MHHRFPPIPTGLNLDRVPRLNLLSPFTRWASAVALCPYRVNLVGGHANYQAGTDRTVQTIDGVLAWKDLNTDGAITILSGENRTADIPWHQKRHQLKGCTHVTAWYQPGAAAIIPHRWVYDNNVTITTIEWGGGNRLQGRFSSADGTTKLDANTSMSFAIPIIDADLANGQGWLICARANDYVARLAYGVILDAEGNWSGWSGTAMNASATQPGVNSVAANWGRLALGEGAANDNLAIAFSALYDRAFSHQALRYLIQHWYAETFAVTRRVVFVAGGPADIPAALTEGTKAGETFDATLTLAPSLTEGLAHGDSVGAVQQMSATLLDGSVSSDAHDSQLNALTALLDGGHSGEIVSPQLDIFALLTAGEAQSDLVSGVLQGQSLLSEGLNLGETFAVDEGPQDFPAALSEGFRAGDTLAPVLAVFTTFVEGLRSGDASAASLAALASQSEGSLTSDLLSTVLAAQGIQTDGLALGELLETLLQLFATQGEGTALGETLLAQLATLPTLTDGAQFSDAFAAELSLIVREGSHFGEALSAQFDQLVNLDESGRLGDTLVTFLTAYALWSEGGEVGETFEAIRQIPSPVAEGEQRGDVLTSVAALRALSEEGLVYGDIFAPVASMQALWAEGARYGDTWLLIGGALIGGLLEATIHITATLAGRFVVTPVLEGTITFGGE